MHFIHRKSSLIMLYYTRKQQTVVCHKLTIYKENSMLN